MDDSLETVERVMALEESLGRELGEGEVPKSVQKLFGEILCKPTEHRWSPPDSSYGWPTQVTVLGRRGSKVLFNAGFRDAFGVGCVGAEGIVENVRVYPSLARALYAFPHHECEI